MTWHCRDWRATLNQATGDRQLDRLRVALKAWIGGGDRTDAAARGILDLLDPELEWIPFHDELQYVATRYRPEDPAGDALAALAEQILAGLDGPVHRPPRWKLQRSPELRRLQKRWTTPDGQELARIVLRELGQGRSLSTLGLGEHDGRVDLRGFVNPEGPDEIVRLFGNSGTLLLHGMDFSGSEMGHVALRRVELHDCLFVGARFAGGPGICDSEVSDTSFHGSDLTEMRAHGWEEHPAPILKHVDFTDAKLNRASFEGEVRDSDFSRASLTHAQFSCHVVRCRFAGYMNETEFYGSQVRVGPGGSPGPQQVGSLQDVDFSEAEFHFVGIRNLDLDRVRFPIGPGYLVVDNWPCVLRYMKAAFDDVPGDDPFRYLGWAPKYGLEGLGPNQQVGLFVLDDLRDGNNGPEVERFLTLLAEARSACGGGAPGVPTR
jgi:uncharacterized protein YjbI with pentapeptide repeats